MKAATSFPQRLARAWRRYRCDSRGTASVELVLCLSLLTIPMLSVIDFGYYVYQQMEVENATQAAVQAIWATCDTAAKMPATVNCTAMTTARDTAVASTSLGSSVSITGTTEDYYCLVGGNLTALGANLNSAKPANCGSAGGSTSDTPGDYVLVTTSFTYTPIFTGVSIVSLLPATITRTAWTRIS